MRPPDPGPVGGVRADQRRDGDDPRFGQDPGDLPGAADALGPVGRREAEVGVEAEPELVAVEHVGRPAHGDEATADLERDGGLAGRGEPGEPHGQAPAGLVQRVDAPTVALGPDPEARVPACAGRLC